MDIAKTRGRRPEAYRGYVEDRATPRATKIGAKGARPLCLSVSEKRMPGTRIELVQRQAPRDFKSLASTYSATQAQLIYNAEPTAVSTVKGDSSTP